jgi:hypothetical protein
LLRRKSFRGGKSFGMNGRKKTSAGRRYRRASFSTCLMVGKSLHSGDSHSLILSMGHFLEITEADFSRVILADFRAHFKISGLGFTFCATILKFKVHKSAFIQM